MHGSNEVVHGQRSQDGLLTVGATLLAMGFHHRDARSVAHSGLALVLPAVRARVSEPETGLRQLEAGGAPVVALALVARALAR